MFHLVRTAIITITCTCASFAIAANWRPIDAELLQLMELTSDSYAMEYEEARVVFYPDETRSYVLTFFSIEGYNRGNNHHLYMAKWLPTWTEEYDGEEPADKVSKYILDGLLYIGGKAYQSIDFAKTIATDEQIILQGTTYGKGDGLCCPSVPITLYYDPSRLTRQNQ